MNDNEETNKQHKIIDSKIINEIFDVLVENIRSVIDERIISTLHGKAPQRRRIRESLPYFRRTR